LALIEAHLLSQPLRISEEILSEIPTEILILKKQQVLKICSRDIFVFI